MITEMVDTLLRLQVLVVQNLTNNVSFLPEDVPILRFYFLVAFAFEGVEDAVILKTSLELDCRVMRRVVLLLNVFAKV